MKKTNGFTLVELIVVTSVLAVLAAVAYGGVSESGQKSRDADRQADLRNLQAAIELFRQEKGRYPSGCNATGTWSGEIGTEHNCSSGGQYIVNLAPAYLPVLPTDPRPNGDDSGYVYVTNTAGTVYKIMVRNSVESETVTYTHPFKSCDATNSSIGMCDATHPSNNKPSYCQENNTQFQTSYALWGGYAVGTSPILVERFTEDVVCDVD